MHTLIKNGIINDVVRRERYVSDILLADGKIKFIGKDIAVENEEIVIDATGKQIYPGFVDARLKYQRE